MLDISFVVPARNEENYIGPCLFAIRSALNWETCWRRPIQSEIIVVDNGSTDCTAAIANTNYNAKVISEPRRGTNRARQTGFEASSKALVAFIDADNILGTDWIPKVQKIMADTNVVAVYGPYVFYDMPWIHSFFSRMTYWIFGWLSDRYPVMTGGNCVIRREALLRLGGFDTTIPFWGDDTATARALAKIGKIELDHSLIVRSSGRRFKKEGYFWPTVNYFRYMYFSEPERAE